MKVTAMQDNDISVHRFNWQRILFLLISALIIPAALLIIVFSTTPIIADNTTVYTVLPGDSLESIAEKYDVDPDSLAEANSLKQAGVTPGDVLIIPALSGTDSGSGTGAGSNFSVVRGDVRFTFNIRDADIRDILNIIALAGGKSIVYAGEPIKASLSMESVTTEEALAYLLEIEGMHSIERDGYRIVGHKDYLSETFSDFRKLARFDLKYITAEDLQSQIRTVGLDCDIIRTEANNSSVWIHGFSDDLVKIGRIVSMIDISDNVSLGSAAISSNLRVIKTDYISAEELSGILSQLSLPPGFRLPRIDDTLYIFAGQRDYEQILEIKRIVDVVENFSYEGSYGLLERIEKIALAYVNSDIVEQLISGFALDVTLVRSPILSKAVWLAGTSDEIDKAREIIKSIDNPEASLTACYSVFTLDYISAAEMAARLDSLSIEGLTVYTYPYPSFNNQILVGCNSDLAHTIFSIVDSLDQRSAVITLPVDFSKSQNGRQRLEQRRNLIAEMTGISTSNFKISGNIDRGDGYWYILYLTESAEEIQRVKDLIAEINRDNF